MSRLKTGLQSFALVIGIGSLSACTLPGNTKPDDPDFAPLIPVKHIPKESTQTTGSLFHTENHLNLFTDRRAFKIGDILTVELVEATQSSMSGKTDLKKDDTLTMAAPKLPTFKTIADTNAELSMSSSFKGSGNSSQGNSLAGKITVTVARVLPNGNLIIKGEKWLNLSGGEEYIRLTGLVRPVDIDPDNVIKSERIANARITYKGQGQVAESNAAGWLGRFFRGLILPF